MFVFAHPAGSGEDTAGRRKTMEHGPGRKLKCARCGEYLRPRKTLLEYLGHRMTYELPGCPVCGQVFVPEEIAKGKMREVETTLEDK